uniref:Transmembrane protein 198 n=1 Tax=Buteo japonicus TaxID=224669 RepID=A0A8C0BGQ9_9AVES
REEAGGMAGEEMPVEPGLGSGEVPSSGEPRLQPLPPSLPLLDALVVPSVVCAMCCLFGIIYCFFGYRCFKAVMFLTGLMFGSIIIFMLCYKERVLDTQLSVEAS